MQQIIPMDPQILCVKIKLQSKVGALFITGQDERVSCIRRVISVSDVAKKKGIAPGDIVFTRNLQYPIAPIRLTVDEEVPYYDAHYVEVLDVSQITAIYKDTEEDDEAIIGMTKEVAEEK